MKFNKTDFVVLRLDEGGVWGFIALKTKPGVEDFLAKNQKAVLVRFNVRMIGNNTPCETFADAERILADEREKNSKAIISMMAPNKELPSEVQGMYYEAEKLFA